MEYSQEKGTPSITSLLEHYSCIPDPVESASVQASRTSADITVVLPTLIETHPLFITRRVEVNYRKAVLLQAAQSMIIDIDSSQSSVRVPLINLTPGTTYRFKVRQANKNGWSDWKGGFEFTTTRQEISTQQRSSAASNLLAGGEIKRVDYENRDHSANEDSAVKKAIDTCSVSALLQLSPNRVSSCLCVCGLPALHYAVLHSEGLESETESLVDALLGMGCSVNQAVDAVLDAGTVICRCRSRALLQSIVPACCLLQIYSSISSAVEAIFCRDRAKVYLLPLYMLSKRQRLQFSAIYWINKL